jgi:hypothetical protein
LSNFSGIIFGVHDIPQRPGLLEAAQKLVAGGERDLSTLGDGVGEGLLVYV